MDESDMKQELAGMGNGAHALALQILGNNEDAEDAVHDAFARVLARTRSFDERKGSLKSWFLSVVRNRCLDVLRRRKPASGAVDELVDSAMQPDQRLEIEQRDERLRRALAAIAVDQRQILVLRDYVDLSYAEIAGVLQIAPGTVMSRLHRARLALKESLDA